MASGAAQGAGAGAAFGPWGAVIGGVAGGVMGGLSGDETAAPNLTAAAAPTGYGAINTGQGGWVMDPRTGAQYFLNNDWGGQQTYDQIFNSTLLNRLMGGSGAGATQGIDQQIAQLEYEIERMGKQAGTQTGTALDPKEYFGEYAPFIKVDAKTGKTMLDEKLGDPDGLQSGKWGPEGVALYQRFMRETGGNYGMGFGNWLRDDMKNNMQSMQKKFEGDFRVNTGNSDTIGANIESMKAKLKQLQGFRQSASGINDQIDNNPYLQELKKERPEEYQQIVDAWRTQGGRDLEKSLQGAELPFNTGNGWLPAGWNADGTSQGGYSGDLRSILEASRGGIYDPQRVATPELDPNAGAYAKNAADYTTATNFQNQRTIADQRAAQRGMLSSAVNEIGRAGDSLALGAEMNKNRFAAMDYFNKAQNSDFQNRLGAEQTYAQAKNAANAQRLSLLGATADLENQQFGRAKSMDDTRYSRQNNEFNLKQQLEQQWRNNYLQSLAGQAGALGQRDTWDQQAWNNRMGFLGAVQGMQNQNFQQGMQNQQFGQGQVNTGLNPSMTWANSQTAYNNALAAGQNQAAFYAAQQQAAANAGNQQAMWSGLGQLGAGLTSYYNKPKQTGGGSTYPNVNLGGWGGGSMSEGGE